jgi:hypothetical protein
MSGDRIRVTFSIDPVTQQVRRDGVALNLSAETPVPYGRGRSKTLGEILQIYGNSLVFQQVEDEVTTDLQEAVGELLFTALGIAALAGDGQGRWVEIAVQPNQPGASPADNEVAEDFARFIRQLPWPLAYDSNLSCFLVEFEWVFTIAGEGAGGIRSDQIFPPEPKILLMLPRRLEFDDQLHRQQASRHRAEIDALLRKHYSQAAHDENVRVVRTWPEAHALLSKNSNFDPDIIYFFGHGVINHEMSHLRFDMDATRSMDVSAAQIATTLRGLPATRRPALFFANCCSGAAARSGFGDRIGALAGCVIANRTIVDLTVASAFGLAVIRGLVGDMDAPHDIMKEASVAVMTAITSGDLAGRWAAPVIQTSYERWITLRPGVGVASRKAAAGRAFERLDRISQVQAAISALDALLAGQCSSLRALTWQSESAQGSAVLGPRLRNELMMRFTTARLREVVVDLQHDSLARDDADFQQQIFESLYVGLARSRIRQAQVASSGRSIGIFDVLALLKPHSGEGKVVLLVRTHALPVDGELGQRLIRGYLKAWLRLFRELTPPDGQGGGLHILLAIGLETPAGVLVQTSDLLRPNAGDTATVIDLGVLGSVEISEIADHLAEYSTIYAAEHDEMAAEIHAATQGVFMPTTLTLKRLASQV